MKTIKILAIISMVLGAYSCTDILEEVKPTSIITTASFFQTPNDAKGAVLGLYVDLRDRTDDDLHRIGEARSELFQEGRQAPIGRELFYLNSLDPVNINLRWVGWYEIIHNANLIIQNVPNIEFTDEAEKNNILAQAHAMRAFVYFTLARAWGGVPIITSPTVGFDPGNQFAARASMEQVFDFVKEDIATALNLFGNDNSFPSGRIQWSKPAVNALKGDVYLWSAKVLGGGEADLNTALAALQEVQTADVALLSDYKQVFAQENEGNQEIIMAKDYTFNESGEMYADGFFIAQTDITDFTNDKYEEIVGAGGGLNRWRISDVVIAQFTDDDSRKDNTFIVIYTPDPVNPADSIFFGVVQTKYRGEIISGLFEFYNDVILYRYADVLLMIAEAKNALGQDPSTEINMVRQRAYGADFSAHTFVSGTQAANDDAILQERLFEFVLEGKRWFDLVRFDKVFELVPSMEGKDSGRILFPVSIETMSLNPELTQNPGY